MTRLRKYLCLGIATLALSTASSTLAQEMTTVDAPAGSLQGVEVDGIPTFKGIPYALPPVGGRRWQPPLPVPHWTGQRDARAFGPACIQPDAKAVSVYTEDPMPQSEDCLSLNVWAPHHAQKAPVLFWIHGGALVNGSSRESMYDGATLAKRGVIVVSINYRLGVLGWMAHPELSAESPDHISGNYGLMDQIAALHWVRDNITAFGGDPANVTIAGESAGALSVLYLLESPAAHGLFAKAVSESGYMISMPELKRAAFGAPSGEAAGQMLGMALQAPDLASLRGMDAKTLTNAAARMFAPWGLVDGKLLPQQMTTAFDKGEIAHVPLLAGFNQGEIRTLRALAPKPPTTAAEYEAGIRARYGDLSDAFLKLYPATNYAESILATTRDGLYGWTAERAARLNTAHGLSVYLYLFDHGYPAADSAGLHAFHASEIPFVFGTATMTPPHWPQIPATFEQHALSAAMTEYWASFARDGVPHAAGAPAWPAYGTARNFMHFAQSPQPETALMPGMFELNEAAQCRKAAAKTGWNWNVGLSSPKLAPNAVCP